MTQKPAPVKESAPKAAAMARPADSALPGLLGLLPRPLQPYAMLARYDRPVGIWLLFIPCLIGLAFQRMQSGVYLADLGWATLFLVGAFAMRGAGCTWNDIRDRDIDAQVARTAGRPLPSGAVGLKHAFAFLAVQLFVGFAVWLCLPLFAKMIALPSLVLVGLYPYMKRVTWWPQAWLGLTMNWGILVGAGVTGSVGPPVAILYAGFVLWTIAYDTIYALQDREDDALIGVRSTARLFGKRAILAIFCFHLGAAGLIALAAFWQGAGSWGAVAALTFLLHGVWQAARLKSSKEREALAVFKSNIWAGLLVLIGFLGAGMVPEREATSLFADREIVEDETEADTVTLPFGLQLKRDTDGDTP